jgi:hypothetical protein
MFLREDDLAQLPPEERVAGLKAEELASALTPEQEEQLLEVLEKRHRQAQTES